MGRCSVCAWPENRRQQELVFKKCPVCGVRRKKRVGVIILLAQGQFVERSGVGIVARHRVIEVYIDICQWSMVVIPFMMIMLAIQRLSGRVVW